MYYIDHELMEFIERPEVSSIVDYWIGVWEDTLQEKFMLGATGSVIKHQIRIVGSQIVVITTSSTVETPFEMRLRLKDRDFSDPVFEPIPSEDWYEPKEDLDIN